ncbi:MAG TPA: leucine-rich repeat domain-containing protein [Verrucomicrobiae bacterium]|jgi:hypothetical protein|nr:leucine-rich repeat domain-containing protein [Verrucomicrobiae bacterium]
MIFSPSAARPWTFRRFASLALCLAACASHAQIKYSTNSDNTLTVLGYNGTVRNLVIPATVNSYPVVAIASNAFAANVGLNSVSVPDTVTNIGDYAFNYCSGLTNAFLGYGVATIGNFAFYMCVNLPGVTLPDTVTNLGASAFADCIRLSSLVLPDSILTMGKAAFEDCQITTVATPSGLVSIGAQTFYACSSLTNITVSTAVTNLGAQAFGACAALKSVFFRGNAPAADSATFVSDAQATAYYIPGAAGWSNSFASLPAQPLYTYLTNNQTITLTGYTAPWGDAVLPARINGLPVTSIGDHAFASSGPSSVFIPETITNLGPYAFDNCANLSCVILPNSISVIPAGAFNFCDRLTNLTIPPGVMAINYMAIANCHNLASVFFRGNAPSGNGFGSDPRCSIYFLPGALGWGASQLQPRAILWNPLLQIPAPDSNQINLEIVGGSNLPIVLESAPRLAAPHWTALASANLTNGSFHFQDSATAPARFYRIRSP